MLLIDTNIIVPYLVCSELSEDVDALFALDPHWRTESFALIEVSNVLATYERGKLLSGNEAAACLSRAEMLLAGSLVSVTHAATLKLAVRHRVTAYDARFLAAAESLELRLVTEDKKLRQAAPEITQSLKQALEGA